MKTVADVKTGKIGGTSVLKRPRSAVSKPLPRVSLDCSAVCVPAANVAVGVAVGVTVGAVGTAVATTAVVKSVDFMTASSTKVERSR